jgi:hypothetical protein
MRLVSLFSALFATVAGIVSVQAQTAQEIIDSTNKTYQGLTSYQVQATSRVMRLSPMGAGFASYDQRYMQTAQPRYVQVSLKLRRPDDWSLAVQARTPGTPVRPTSSNKPATPPAPVPPVITFSSIARWGTQPAEVGQLQNDRFQPRGLPAVEFINEVREMLNPSGLRELVIVQFEPSAGSFDTTRTFQLVAPELIEDSIKDPSLHVIRGRTKAGEPVVVWIDKERFLVTRVVVFSPENAPGYAGSGDPRMMESRGMMSVHETIYQAQVANPQFQNTDFTLQTPTTIGSINTSQPWLPQQQLIALIYERRPPPTKPDGSLTAEKPEAVVTARSVPETQALSHEQMSGIVLIEGDGGTATGFMTKIRDVDFVVTNLHVLGGNKKISLKTLGGEEIPVMGIFGAAGVDIAIIRIGSGKGDLKLAADVFKTSKIGDKVVVVGNRQGGGVATQTAGSILGVGPTRIEVNANFEPGNSGSPIVNLTSGEVVGVASYAETRRIDVEETAGSTATRTGRKDEAPKVEKRWFGYRIDSVAKWEAIDLARWNAQEARVDAFRDMSEALVAVLRLDFSKARQHPRLASLITNFETRMRSTSGTGVSAATEVKDLFRVIRTISEDGVNDLKNGDYYDYYRTSLYWETSIPAQLEYRKAIVEMLKKYEANSAGYLSRMRGGN